MAQNGGGVNYDTSTTNYVPLVPYNGSGPTGGNSLNDNLNIYYEVTKECPRLTKHNVDD